MKGLCTLLLLAGAGCTCAEKPAPSGAPSTSRAAAPSLPVVSPEHEAKAVADMLWLRTIKTADLGAASHAIAGGTGVVWIGTDDMPHVQPFPKDLGTTA